MAFSDKVEIIQANAQREARSIIDGAQLIAENNIKQALQEADIEHARMLKEAEFQAKQEAQKISFDGRTAAREHILSVRAALVENAVSRFAQMLKDREPEELVSAHRQELETLFGRELFREKK
ncbi:MAG: hypothetical protein JJE36_03870 [Coriobacteriia bacterium]|nr:hypothetical protein [Coriobacteriia bacterium]